MRLDELCKKIGASYLGEASTDIKGVAPIESAGPNEVTFLANPEYRKHLESTQAGAVILAEPAQGLSIAQIVHSNPYASFARVAGLFYKPDHGPAEIHPTAVIARGAQIGKDVRIGAHVTIEDGVILGDRVVLYPGVYVGRQVTIGSDSCVHANTVIEYGCHVGERVIIHASTVVGADGFGFAPDKDGYVKVPQTGNVVIEDDVELGACCTIDRATLGSTRIGRGTKFDSKVHIGHNATIGEHCVFAAQTAIAGSAKIGSWVMAGGHAGVAGHLNVGDRVKIGAMTGIIKDAKAGETYMGFPAVTASKWRRRQVYLDRLPEYDRKLKTHRS